MNNGKTEEADKDEAKEKQTRIYKKVQKTLCKMRENIAV